MFKISEIIEAIHKNFDVIKRLFNDDNLKDKDILCIVDTVIYEDNIGDYIDEEEISASNYIEKFLTEASRNGLYSLKEKWYGQCFHCQLREKDDIRLIKIASIFDDDPTVLYIFKLDDFKKGQQFNEL